MTDTARATGRTAQRQRISQRPSGWLVRLLPGAMGVVLALSGASGAFAASATCDWINAGGMNATAVTNGNFNSISQPPLAAGEIITVNYTSDPGFTLAYIELSIKDSSLVPIANDYKGSPTSPTTLQATAPAGNAHAELVLFGPTPPGPGVGTANITVTCTPVAVPTPTPSGSSEHTSALIQDFLRTRADLILANQPNLSRRIARLNGITPSGGNPVSALMGYLPGIVEGNPLDVSTSLAAIDAMAGNQQPSPFDVWFEGTFALFDAKGPEGNFNAASLGADYLVNPDLLVGGFVQLDRLSQHSPVDPATVSGTGWLAGPYATARLSDNLYLDLLAAAGTSSNSISPLGTYEDGFDATRWLVSASLQGQWQWDAWTFSPRARLSYFEETAKAYTDSLGVGIPSITAGLGQLAIGPAIAYRFTTESNVVIDTGLRLEAITDIFNTSGGSGFDNWHGRIEGTIDMSLPGGARLGLSAAYNGIGSDTGSATSAKVTIGLPMQ